MHQPSYQDACRIWAHVGHSGWQWTLDVELFRDPQDGASWSGLYRLPASQLPNAGHIEVQMVFKGQMPDGYEQWDNNDGNNWQVVADVELHEGLVPPPDTSRARVSGLLLLLQALRIRRLLTPQQEELLRHLAVQRDSSLLRAYSTVQCWADEAAAASMLLSRTIFNKRPGLHVLHVASEMVPVAKVGGLADVVTSLAKAHQSTGTLVEVVMPKYDCSNYRAIDQLRHLTSFSVAWAGSLVKTHAWCGVVEGLPVYLIEPEQPAAFFWRGRFYGEADDVERFLFFSRAVLEFLLTTDKQPDLLHLHDWQSAAVAPLLANEFRDRGLAHPRTLLTLHNIAFQGWMTPDLLCKAGLDPQALALPHLMLDDSRPGFIPGSSDVSLLRGGVVFADKVTTVSPTYAQEVYRPEFGCDDPYLRPGGHYTAEDTSGKQVCKQALLAELGLPFVDPQVESSEWLKWAPDKSNSGGANPGLASCVAPAAGGMGRPLIAIISRLTQQKGLPLMLHGMKVALERGAQLVVLGSASEPEVQAQFTALAAQYNSGSDARLVLRYDEGLAHRIYAGADIILIPSFFEPCGLTQLIALRYGTIPVVNATGGLADTVRDVANHSFAECERNGFVFW
eukprot:gene10075-10230_t